MNTRYVTFPHIEQPDRGSLSYGEIGRSIPFDVKRVYWIYGVPTYGQPVVRGNHAHRVVHQVFICVHGSVTFLVEEKPDQIQNFPLRLPDEGLFLPALAWHQMRDFAPNTVLLSLASGVNDEAEYIRDRKEWEALATSIADTRSSSR